MAAHLILKAALKTTYLYSMYRTTALKPASAKESITGVPQGFIVSPMLFNVVITHLAHELEELWTQKLQENEE